MVPRRAAREAEPVVKAVARVLTGAGLASTAVEPVGMGEGPVLRVAGVSAWRKMCVVAKTRWMGPFPPP